MKSSLSERSNAAWIEALHARNVDATAVRELEEYLRRALSRLVRIRLAPEDLAELVQESLARIIESLASFRGDSAFTTWATGVATRVAFTELRRRRVRDDKHVSFEAVVEEVRAIASSDTDHPENTAARTDLVRALERAIMTKLSERQRVAILAELREIPTIEIAERLNTNQNALYKLIHDARKKLRRALLESGFSADSVHDFVQGVTR